MTSNRPPASLGRVPRQHLRRSHWLSRLSEKLNQTFDRLFERYGPTLDVDLSEHPQICHTALVPSTGLAALLGNIAGSGGVITNSRPEASGVHVTWTTSSDW
jgi:hypothetical protein